MPNAPSPAGLFPQLHQGVGARVLHRFGGALRNVIAGGIALTGRLRGPAAPQPSRTPPSPRNPAPASQRSPAPRRPRTAPPAPSPRPARTGWLARWFGRTRLRPASLARLALPDSDHARFTPEAYPHLSPEVCEFLNTPVKDCDPDLLGLVLHMLAQHITETMPPELGLDARALFSTLCDRLAPPPDETWPDAPADDAPSPAPAAPEQGEPDAPAAPPSPIQPQAEEPADAAIPTQPAKPDIACPTGPVLGCGRTVFDRRRSSHRRHRPRDRLAAACPMGGNSCRPGAYAMLPVPVRPEPSRAKSGAPDSGGNARGHRMAVPPFRFVPCHSPPAAAGLRDRRQAPRRGGAGLCPRPNRAGTP